MSISLACYSIRVRKKHVGGKSSNLKLSSFDGKTDFLDVVTDFFDALKKASKHDVAEKRLMSLVNMDTDSRVLRGRVKTGDYGFEAELYDVIKSSTTYTRSPDEAQLLPFFFYVNIPKNVDEGLLILQRFQQFGIRTHFWSELNSFFELKFPDYKIQINPLVPKEYVKHLFENGSMTALRFIKFDVPSDLADAVSGGGHIEDDAYVELAFKAKRFHRMLIPKNVKKWLGSKKKVTEIFEIEDFEYNEIKIDLELEGRKKTLNLTDLGKLRAYLDVTNDVKLTKGHPTFTSVSKAADDIAKGLSKSLWGGS